MYVLQFHELCMDGTYFQNGYAKEAGIGQGWLKDSFLQSEACHHYTIMLGCGI